MKRLYIYLIKAAIVGAIGGLLEEHYYGKGVTFILIYSLLTGAYYWIEGKNLLNR